MPCRGRGNFEKYTAQGLAFCYKYKQLVASGIDPKEAAIIVWGGGRGLSSSSNRPKTEKEQQQEIFQDKVLGIYNRLRTGINNLLKSGNDEVLVSGLDDADTLIKDPEKWDKLPEDIQYQISQFAYMGNYFREKAAGHNEAAWEWGQSVDPDLRQQFGITK